MNIKMKIVLVFVITLIVQNVADDFYNCDNLDCSSDEFCRSKYFHLTDCKQGKGCCEALNPGCKSNSLYCQRSGVTTSSTYCREMPQPYSNYCVKLPRSQRLIQYCFDGVTPWVNEPKCEKIDGVRYVCQTDDKRSRGTCRFGHCCPHRRMNKKKPVLSAYNYRTNINCDPNGVLLPVYQYAFCGSEKKVWLLGNSSLESGQLRKKIVCRTHADCDVKRVCVNMMHGVRICMFDTDHEMNPVNPKIPWYDFSQIED